MNDKPRKGIPPRAGFVRIVRKSVPALILLTALAVVVLIAVVLKKRSEDKPAGGRPPVNVETIVIRPEPLVSDMFEIVGKVEADRVVDVSAEVAGRVERIVRPEGRDVRAGDPIIRLNTDILRAEFDLAKAQSQFDVREYKRISDLHEKGAATANEADQARTKAAISKAAFDIAKARLERATIVAPIDGTLDKVVPEVGTYLKSGDIVAKIVDSDPAKVVVDVPERDVPFLKIGREEKIVIKGMEQESITGIITYISKLIDHGSNTTRAEISADNRASLLRDGQIVNVHLLRRELHNAILIPLEKMISMEDGKKVAYVVEDGKAVRREVEMDLSVLIDGRVRIIAGLAEGDRLIVNGLRFVSPGRKVREKRPNVPSSQPSSQPVGADKPSGKE